MPSYSPQSGPSRTQVAEWRRAGHLCASRPREYGRAVPVRRNMTLAVKRLIRDVAERLPEFAHVRASRVLVVAGEARGTSRATIRPAYLAPLSEAKHRRFIRVRGRRMLYVMTLRPLWFAESTPEERVSTILHELYHASTRFDGTLHRGRRHKRFPRAAYDRHIRELLGVYLSRAPEEVVAAFDGEGIVKVKMWLRVPRFEHDGSSAIDVDEHLIHGFMPLRRRTSRPRRSVRLARARGADEEGGG